MRGDGARQFGHIFIEPKPKADFSWWADAQRVDFTARAEKEMPRMRGSKAYTWLGMPPVVGQTEGRAPKAQY